jgi:hypothetical protein
MTLTQLIADQYDIDCNSEDEVEQVEAVLKKHKLRDMDLFVGGTVVWLYNSHGYATNNKLSSIDKTISATDFLKLNL